MLHRLFALALLGCTQTYTTTVFTNPVERAPADDPVPPVPAGDPSLDFEGSRGVENHSELRFRFDVAAFENDHERAEAARLYPSHAAHLRAHPGSTPSVQTIVTYAKQLDDTIIAGVELAVQHELAPGVPAKRALLADTLAYLLAHRDAGADEAIVVIAAASHATVPSELAPRVAALAEGFDREAARARPIGFYSWSAELRALWRQDRLLQTPLSAPAACAAAHAIGADPARERSYRMLVALDARLTNPQDSLAADGACSSPHTLFGVSRSVEDALFAKLYPAGVPADADLMRDLVQAIRGGLVTAPAPGDGWYQYQEYALEPLLVTDHAEERAKIAFTARYKQRLVEAFATMLSQHRETHVEHHSHGHTASVVPAQPWPSFAAEPLATVYVRHARSYVFLERALEQTLGSELLDRAPAVGAAGPEPETLRTRIRRARDLYFGVYLVACQELGMPSRLDDDGDPPADTRAVLATRARTWLANLANDPIAAADVRVAIPIAAVPPDRMKYWVVIGVRTTIAGYSYVHDDTVPEPARLARVPLPTEQFLEVVSSTTPPTRDELRALCDRLVTPEAIRAALERR